MNFMHMQLMCESMSRFCESFGAFLYGMEVNAFCVDFPEVSCCAPLGGMGYWEQEEGRGLTGGWGMGRHPLSRVSSERRRRSSRRRRSLPAARPGGDGGAIMRRR